ncbi:MAG: hypothetical protein N2C12_10505, partial [Planctomycetales bacterium]
MRITIINQFYPPDISPTGKLAASLANHRAALGDDVTIIAGHGYVRQADSEETNSHKRVRLQRAWFPQLGKSTLLRRCIDYLVFIFTATCRVILLPRQDVVICLTTPPYIVCLGVLHKVCFRQTKIILWNMDCYPEAAERAGVLRPGGKISSLLQVLNRWLNGWIDHVVCLDEAMRNLILRRGNSDFSRHSTSVIPNWETMTQYPSPIGESLPAANHAFTILYSG